MTGKKKGLAGRSIENHGRPPPIPSSEDNKQEEESIINDASS